MSNNNVLENADGISVVLDEEDQRMVVGFATLDNIDQTGDIVTSEASLKAFGNFRGNVRLMHLPEPVGKVVDFRPAVYIDENTGEQYAGIQVTAKISKAAEKAWIMCQDGTISGFSIGGQIMKTSTRYDETAGRTVNVIEDYVLTELSLVDNPANQYANITSFRKSADNVIQAGDKFEVVGNLNKVFELNMKGGHPTVAQENTNEENVVEKSNDEVNPSEDSQTANEISNDSVEDTNTDEVSSEESTAEPVEAKEVTGAEPAADEIETEDSSEDDKESESEEKVIDIKAEFERMHEELKEFLNTATSQIKEDMTQKINSLGEEMTKRFGDVEVGLKETNERVEAEKSLSDKLDDLSKSFNGRLDEISKSAAFKKSADNEPERSGNSTWKGAFTGALGES